MTSPIRGELGYAHRPQLGSQIHCPIGNQIWGSLGKEDVCPNGYQILCSGIRATVIRANPANANPPKPRSCPKWPFG